MSILQSSLHLLRQQAMRIIILAITIVLPVQVITFGYVNYFYAYYGLLDLVFIADALYAFLILLGLSVVQIPFIKIAKLDTGGDQVTLRDAYKATIIHMFPIFVMGIVYAFFTVLGGIFFIIPGIVFSLLFFLFPYVAVMEGTHWWKGFKRAFIVAKKHLLKLFLLIFLLGITEAAIDLAIQYTLTVISGKVIILLLIQWFINSVFIAYFSFLISKLYIEWTGLLETEEHEDWLMKMEF
ncbi:hypothetical protein [Mechercharimyces sp. CAU 1602]|uniref:hypothetical protein n=1 Tax=Mechercharimyces sp. CAU 1602 TaxID=2973933 RepID=UPI002162A335|nr:hypothetical protein [Mechercharimyces sp. CAU 1602]MCS1352437.1 hypothetical protein [Mechercharimyces sp. CAU 1602]